MLKASQRHEGEGNNVISSSDYFVSPLFSFAAQLMRETLGKVPPSVADTFNKRMKID
jgi:hypothetical protein